MAGVAVAAPPTTQGSHPEPFIAWAGRTAQPGDADHLASVIGDARVIALGEFMHGGREPLALRNASVKALATRGKITAIALETGLIEARRLNAYVQGGEGDATALAHAFFTWTFGDLEANVELLRWLRRYNGEPGHAAISLYGVDIPGGLGLTVGSISIGVRDALDYLRRTRLTDAEPFIPRLQPYAVDLSLESWLRSTPSTRGVVVQTVDDLTHFLAVHRKALVAASTAQEFAWAQRSAVVLRQGVEIFRVWPVDNPHGTSPKGMYQTVAVRDRAMADNLLWLLDHEGPSGRILLFAATGHVVRSLSLGPVPPGFLGPWSSMGRHLDQRLGRRMTVIFTGAAEGPPGPGPWAGKPEAGSLAEALARVQPQPYLLDLRKAPPDPWLDQPRALGGTLMGGMVAKPRDAFDAVVFFPAATPARKAGSPAGAPPGITPRP